MEPAHITHYNKALRNFANANRKNATKAEVCLWKYVLKAKQMKGHTFNRQRPVLNYIADFMCKPLNLIIEVDGNTHDEEAVKAKDIIKTRDLQNAGYIVLRFTDDDVLKNIELVKKEIEAVVLTLECKN